MSDAGEEELRRLWRQLVERALAAEPAWVPAAFTAALLLVFLASLLGNLLTCVVIYSDRSLHTATNYYLFNLAVSDLVVTMAIILEVGHLYLQTQNRTLFEWYNETACKIHFLFVVMLWNNGILVMTALAVERYVAICHPLMLKGTPVWQRVSKVIAGIWALALLVSLPEVWTVGLTSSVCFIVPSRFARVLNALLVVLTFLLPLGIMVFVYSMIAYQLNKAQKTSSRDKVFNHRDNRSRVNKLIIALTVSFLVCWLPFFSVRAFVTITDPHNPPSFSIWWSVFFKFSVLNSWFSAVLNPLLFSLMSTKFRNALRRLWNRKVRGESTIIRALRATRTSKTATPV